MAHIGQRKYNALAKIQKLRCHIHGDLATPKTVRDSKIAGTAGQRKTKMQTAASATE